MRHSKANGSKQNGFQSTYVFPISAEQGRARLGFGTSLPGLGDPGFASSSPLRSSSLSQNLRLGLL